MQSAKQVVSITGTAELIVDKEAARALWNESWRPRFPKGPDDDELALLHVRAADAEFCDVEGLRGFVYLFDAVRHSVRGGQATAEPVNRHDAQCDDDDPPTLRGWLKSHLHGSSLRARSSSDPSLELSNSGSAETVRPLESNAGDTEQTPNG